MNIALISEASLKEKSALTSNFDSKLIKISIVEAQNLYLKPLLGKELFNTILLQVSGNTVTSENRILIKDYIQPYLVYTVLVDLIKINQYKLTNKGVLKMNDDSASTVDSKELDNLIGFYHNKMDSYKNQLIEYLECESEIENLPDLSSQDNFSSLTGWYLEDIDPTKWGNNNTKYI